MVFKFPFIYYGENDQSFKIAGLCITVSIFEFVNATLYSLTETPKDKKYKSIEEVLITGREKNLRYI